MAKLAKKNHKNSTSRMCDVNNIYFVKKLCVSPRFIFVYYIRFYCLHAVWLQNYYFNAIKISKTEVSYTII